MIEVDEEDIDTVDQEAGPKAMDKNEVAWMAWPGSNDNTDPAYTEGSMTLGMSTNASDQFTF